MITIYILILSLIIYTTIIYTAIKHPGLYSINIWPFDKNLRFFWYSWLVFLLILTPFTYNAFDLPVWVISAGNLIKGEILPDKYVYLPVYAMFQAAIAFPFIFFLADIRLLLVFIVKLTVILSYAYLPKIMVSLADKDKHIAPLPLVIAPIIIYYIFFGTNHIVTAFLLASSLLLMKKRRYILAGFLAGLSCYKFLLIPAIVLIFIIIFLKRGARFAIFFFVGIVISFIPSFLYYINDPSRLLKKISSFGAIGAHCVHIEPFHFLFAFKKFFPHLEAIYIHYKIWLFIVFLGFLLSVILYIFKLLNPLQAISLCYAITVIVIPEPFRLEPLIVLLWLDALNRDSYLLRLFTWILLLVHSASWFDFANFRSLAFDNSMPFFLWEYRGVFIAAAVITTIIISLVDKKNNIKSSEDIF